MDCGYTVCHWTKVLTNSAASRSTILKSCSALHGRRGGGNDEAGEIKVKSYQRFFTLAAAVLLSTSAQGRQDVSFDGLVQTEAREFKLVYVDPDVDFSVYSKFIPGPAAFQFRAVKKTSGNVARRHNQTEYWISNEDKQKLAAVVSSIFADELAKSEIFTEATEPGPDTLIIRGAMHDIVSQTPPDLVGRNEIWLSSVAEATLIIEALDSLSGEVIYRAIERRAAQRPGGQLMVANTVTSWAEVRRMARLWAVRLREAMDSVRD